MNFSLLDLVFLGSLGVAAYLGYRSGALRKGIMLLGMVGAIFLSAKLTSMIAPFLMKIGFGRIAAEVTTFIVLFILFMSVLFVLYRRFGKTSAGHTSSRLFGALFGLVEGVLILSFVLIAMNVMGLPDKVTRRGSMLYQPIVQVLPEVFGLVRAHLPGAAEVKEGLKNVL